jgi:hypothetical protein
LPENRCGEKKIELIQERYDMNKTFLGTIAGVIFGTIVALIAGKWGK